MSADYSAIFRNLRTARVWRDTSAEWAAESSLRVQDRLILWCCILAAPFVFYSIAIEVWL